MSLFEDPYEIAQTAMSDVSGSRRINTVRKAVERVQWPENEIVVVMDWESVRVISDSLGDSVSVSVPDHVVREHIELDTQRIEQALPGGVMVMGADGSPFGVALYPGAVTLENEPLHENGAVRIEWEHVE